MEVLFIAYAAITLALLIAQLLEYVAKPERLPLSRCNVIALKNASTGLVCGPVAKPQMKYDRAA